MPRLPEVGGDDGKWGKVLNDYLSVAHNSDGTLKLAPEITSAQQDAASALETAQSAVETATAAETSASEAATTAQGAQAVAAAAQPQVKQYPDPTQVAALAPFRTKLLMCRRQKVTITCVTDSIGWGVGSDGLSASTTGAMSPQQDIYRENAWPYQLASVLNAPYGTPPVNGWLGPGYSNYSDAWAASTSSYLSIGQQSQGPFGYQSGTAKGGAQIKYGGWIEWDTNTLDRAFTELDVLVWAGPQYVDGAFPSILVDGTSVRTGSATAGSGVDNQLSTVTITGLTDAQHTVRIVNDVAGCNVYGGFIVPRRNQGVVVNRIGSSGGTSLDAVGDVTNGSRPRIVSSSVLPGYSDLAIIALSTNDYLFQTSLAQFKANIQQLITACAGAPVLLIDGPPVNSVTEPILLPKYTEQLIDLATSNSNVAFAPLSALFGARADGVARGLFSAPTSVHPSWIGANLIANYLAYVLQRSFKSP